LTPDEASTVRDVSNKRKRTNVLLQYGVFILLANRDHSCPSVAQQKNSAGEI